MSSFASEKELTPAALQSQLGVRSPIARQTIQALVDSAERSCDAAPQLSAATQEKLARSAAIARWQRNLGIAEADPVRLIAATQLYVALVIQSLAESVVRQIGWKETSQSLAAYSLPSLERMKAEASPSLRSASQTVREAIVALRLGEGSIGHDYFKTFYQQLIPREVRHALGEYYTPDWLAEHLFEQVAASQPVGRLIDPTCGSGTFLLQGIRRRKELLAGESLTNAEVLANISTHVVGIDVNPLAVAAARLNYLLAVVDLLSSTAPLPDFPVYQADSVLLPPTLQSQLGRFELVIGNPPWVGWETLPIEYREQTRDLWLHYGLFPHRGMNAILGSGKKDLSMLLSYVASDQLLADRGRLAFITTQAVFKTSAGAGFRRFVLPSSVPLGVEHVEDLSEVQPFPGASNRTVLFVWQKGKSTNYPLPYFIWRPAVGNRRRLAEDATRQQVLQQVDREVSAAIPAQADNPTSIWLTMPAEQRKELSKLLGPSPYHAHEGANTGGANAVYWLQTADETEASQIIRGEPLARLQNIVAGAKRPVPQVSAELETDLLYPLLRGADVRRWRATSSAWLLLVQDPIRRQGIETATLQERYPHVASYLQQFEPMLRQRAAFKRYFERSRGGQRVSNAPYYSMFDVGEYTLAPCKVVWHRMLAPVQAAVVETLAGKPIVPQETLAFIACQSPAEAHYLAGLLNSQLFNTAAAAYSQAGGKSFASPHLLTHLCLPKFVPDDPRHLRVSQEAALLAEQARSLPTMQRGRKAPALDQSQLDRYAAEVWQV